MVVALDQGALFQGNEVEVGLSGYRVLYKFGKVLKTVKDRKIVVTVPGDAKAVITGKGSPGTSPPPARCRWAGS